MKRAITSLLCLTALMLTTWGPAAGQRPHGPYPRPRPVEREQVRREQVRPQERRRERVERLPEEVFRRPAETGERAPEEVRRPEREATRPGEREWKALTRVEKRTRAEHLGEVEMGRMASRMGYRPELSAEQASRRPQGYDAVYRDPRGQVVVAEAKGGYNGRPLEATLGNGYGHRQGTIGWAVAAAREILRPESTANRAERRAAELVLQAHAEGQLRVEVFHTQHQFGVPLPTRIAVTGRQRQ